MTANELLRHHITEMVKFRKRLELTLPDGYHYQGAEDYILDRGSIYHSASLTADERKVVQDAIAACPSKRFRMGHCYYNAQILVAYDRTGQLQYCEGVASGWTRVPLLHGWVVINGKVVDLTWRTPKPLQRGILKDRIWGVFPDKWAYYGVTFDTESLMARMWRIKATGSLLDDIAHGFPLFQEPRLGVAP